MRLTKASAFLSAAAMGPDQLCFKQQQQQQEQQTAQHQDKLNRHGWRNKAAAMGPDQLQLRGGGERQWLQQ
jgi:hypothetical protein